MTIELVGGPVDGRRLPVCGDPMNPPRELRVAEPTTLRLTPHDGPPSVEDAMGAFRVLLYVRDDTPRTDDTGPCWLYRLQPAPSRP